MLIYVCDDSKSDRLRLVHNIQTYIRDNGAEAKIECFDNAEAMLNSFRYADVRPAIVFLDIFMAGRDGMTAASELISLGMESGIVFTTSSESHALNAFRIGADGYLHKPYTQEEFANAMKRFQPLFADTKKYIMVKSKRSEIKVNLASVLYVEASSHCCFVHTSSDVIRSSSSIGDFADVCTEEEGFISCGRSYYIRLNAVEKISEDGSLNMFGGDVIYVPVRLRKQTEKIVRDYMDKMRL